MIHVVQSGETINSIAENYNIPVERLISENGITNPDNLAVGQTIVIVQPEILYTIKQGDTLEDIAELYRVSVMELLRNNPYLSDDDFLYPGETIVISYQTDKTKTIVTNGYIFSYIERSVLIKTLPFLTYMTIFNYRSTMEGEIRFNYDDTEIVNLAKSYGVVPLMFLSTMSEEGIVNPEVGNHILNNPEVQDRLIENAMRIMEEKGFYGINLYVENISSVNINVFTEYLQKASEIFHSNGYKFLITITPTFQGGELILNFTEADSSEFVEFVDGIIFTSYDWARSYSYPLANFPINVLRDLLDSAVQLIPPEKTILGVTALGYDWSLPYIPGVTGATIITYDRAVQIAADHGIEIQFNEVAQAPYFYYISDSGNLQMVWTKDARSFDARGQLSVEYDLLGLSIWTIMRFDAQMWFLYNTQYYIERL